MEREKGYLPFETHILLKNMDLSLYLWYNKLI